VPRSTYHQHASNPENTNQPKEIPPNKSGEHRIAAFGDNNLNLPNAVGGAGGFDCNALNPGILILFGE